MYISTEEVRSRLGCMEEDTRNWAGQRVREAAQIAHTLKSKRVPRASGRTRGY